MEGIPWGQWLGGPIVQGLTGLFSMGEQDRLQSDYEADVDRQRAEALGVASQVGPETLATYDSGAMPALMELMGLRPRAMAGQRNVVQGFRDRYNTAVSDLEGYGRQMGRDIDRRFEEDLASRLSGMTQRGISSSTARASQSALNEELRNSEQRRLGEDLQRLRFSILPGLSGETLGAMERGVGLDTALTNALSGWHGSNAMNRANIVGRGYGTMLDTITGVQHVPPPPNQTPGMVGANLVDPVDATKGVSSSAPWIQAGGQVAGAAVMATIVIGICIGEDSLIDCVDRDRTLGDIMVGDMALNADGQPRRVVAKHLTAHKGEWNHHFVRLHLNGKSITISRDHRVEGKRASDWEDDGVHTEPAAECWVGDILLEDGSDYVANGLRVSSIIQAEDVAALKAMEPENQEAR